MKKIILLLVCVFFTHTTFGQIKLDSTDLGLYAETISGRFSTQLHQTFDKTKDDVLVRTSIVKKDSSIVWMYTQQGEFIDGEYYPYRQRIYELKNWDEYRLRLNIYAFKDDEMYWDIITETGCNDCDTTFTTHTDRLIVAINDTTIIPKVGCELLIWKDSMMAFRGSTVGNRCKGSFRGATYTTTEFVVYPHQVISWERGWNDEGEQRWGPKNGPYIYSKVSSQ